MTRGFETLSVRSLSTAQRIKKMSFSPLKGFLLAGLTLAAGAALACPTCKIERARLKRSPDFQLKTASVTYVAAYDSLVFEQKVRGLAGRTKPAPKGALDGAPVMGYVFPTTLKSQDIGFSPTEGIVALALTSHPDFDDTPIWDENNNGKYDDDGLLWHAHWVVLVKDKRVGGGLSVKEFKKTDAVVRPRTAPDMPMYMDSPNFTIVRKGDTIRVIVPRDRVGGKINFKFDAVAAYMQVADGKSHGSLPMLGVHEVYSVLSKNLSLPYSVRRR
jgi:hypothetical protein